MIASLRLRLLLTLLSVVIVVVGMVALFTSQITRSEFQRYVERDTQRNQRVLDALFKYYAEHPDLQNVQPVVSQIQRDLGERIILTDGVGKVIADSEQALIGQTIDCQLDIQAVIVTLGQLSCPDVPIMEPIAAGTGTSDHSGDILFIGVPMDNTLVLQPDPAPQSAVSPMLPLTIRRVHGSGLDPIAAGFISAVNRSLVLAVVVAGGVALLLTAMLSRRILGPIETLTTAARKMEKGDLSQRVPVRSRDEIGVLTHAFNSMADGLTRLETLRRRMVADIAHELRTPLTNIRCHLEILRDGVVELDATAIETLDEEAQQLNRLIDDLQELAVVEARQMQLMRQPINLNETIGRTVAALQPLLSDKELAVIVDVRPDLPLVEADPNRVGQVLRNLLSNAIRYTPHGGTITVAAVADDRDVAVSVRDTGIGIAPEHLPYIFERFFRVDRSRTRATGGTGIGLTIAKELVEAHGGVLRAESMPGSGSVFTFTLPALR
jgi:signal transduction histidine kinase